ncbi:hypothetical protein vseg_019964 [Gypsophila vaccaria]
MSTVNIRKAPVATFKKNTTAHAHNRSTTTPAAKHEKAVTTPVLPPNNYKTSCDDNEIEIIRPTAFLDHSGHINKVISFHSSRCWREYFQASKQWDKLIVIYFTASWCGPCRFMAPVVDEFASHYANVAFNKIDVDELFNVSHDFGVQTMPTFLFIKRGTEIDRVTGARRDELQRKIEKHRDYPHY